RLARPCRQNDAPSRLVDLLAPDVGQELERDRPELDAQLRLPRVVGAAFEQLGARHARDDARDVVQQKPRRLERGGDMKTVIEPLARVAEAVHRHGCKITCQLLHVGLRASAVSKQDPAYDFDADWYMVAPSQVPPGEYPNAPMPKELEEHEIEEILGWYEAAARRAIAAGLDGVEFHMSHGYLPWQFLSPLYNHRQDGWGGS